MIENNPVSIGMLCSYLKQLQDANREHDRAQNRLDYYRGRRTKLKRREPQNNKVTEDIEAKIESARKDILRAKRDRLALQASLKPLINQALVDSASTLTFHAGAVEYIRTPNGKIHSSRFTELAEEYEATEAMNKVLE